MQMFPLRLSQHSESSVFETGQEKIMPRLSHTRHYLASATEPSTSAWTGSTAALPFTTWSVNSPALGMENTAASAPSLLHPFSITSYLDWHHDSHGNLLRAFLTALPGSIR